MAARCCSGAQLQAQGPDAEGGRPPDVQRWNLPVGWVIANRAVHPALVTEARRLTTRSADLATPRLANPLFNRNFCTIADALRRRYRGPTCAHERNGPVGIPP
jgi:hypothetical protein